MKKVVLTLVALALLAVLNYLYFPVYTTEGNCSAASEGTTRSDSKGQVIDYVGECPPTFRSAAGYELPEAVGTYMPPVEFFSLLVGASIWVFRLGDRHQKKWMRTRELESMDA